jgi:hypothetical protein
VSLQASKNSKEFLVNVLESEYNGAKEDMQRQLSRQGYGIKQIFSKILMPNLYQMV